ncbi:hypothetical protein PSHT_00672 [Puccinia striiformis]|uniref:Uncharacterized protein n=1 Tax=Puccinia striiformis TaxID=27350 RepID=A0A2S4WMI8_9BASI|nr:hypothetical protein PSHT_00672 [Puccinia striiformis]
MSSGQPYDPYIPGGQPPQKGNQKTQAIQAQIDDTVGIMRDNITKITLPFLHRFQTRSESSQETDVVEDMKMRLLIALGVIVLLLIIIIPIVDAEPLGPIRPPSASTNSSSTDGGVPNRFAPPT